MNLSNKEFPRILIGIIFLLSGLNSLLEIFPLRLMSPESSNLFMNIKTYGIFWSLIAFAEILGGALLIFGSMGQLAVFILAPVTLALLFFHSYLSPAGLWHGYVLFALEIFLIAYYWRNIGQLLGWRKTVA